MSTNRLTPNSLSSRYDDRILNEDNSGEDGSQTSWSHGSSLARHSQQRYVSSSQTVANTHNQAITPSGSVSITRSTGASSETDAHQQNDSIPGRVVWIPPKATIFSQTVRRLNTPSKSASMKQNAGVHPKSHARARSVSTPAPTDLPLGPTRCFSNASANLQDQVSPSQNFRSTKDASDSIVTPRRVFTYSQTVALPPAESRAHGTSALPHKLPRTSTFSEGVTSHTPAGNSSKSSPNEKNVSTLSTPIRPQIATASTSSNSVPSLRSSINVPNTVPVTRRSVSSLANRAPKVEKSSSSPKTFPPQSPASTSGVLSSSSIGPNSRNPSDSSNDGRNIITFSETIRPPRPQAIVRSNSVSSPLKTSVPYCEGARVPSSEIGSGSPFHQNVARVGSPLDGARESPVSEAADDETPPGSRPDSACSGKTLVNPTE
ncbi:hypothetical protein BCR39DRAFT_555765 [Naematelia encephala]|uniref:Uncharacterized protein n=1 Tax=Naematelia encephala TaxID=71784 RepID=A0A1Y2BLG6_9TREE|nr:hypothetical protein BCR39DRAFT_555765 [Naematelia encephala]